MPILFSRAKFATWIINNPNELHLGDEGEKPVDTNQSGKDGGGKEGEREAKKRATAEFG
jgi:hypothetical protein